jgi:hypothetical protein
MFSEVTSINKLVKNEHPIIVGFIFFYILFLTKFIKDDLFSPTIVLLGFSIFIYSLKLNRSYIKQVYPLLVVLLIGLFGIFGHESRHIFRDIIYALTPISLIYIGWWISNKKVTLVSVLKKIIIYAIIFSLIHLFQFFINPSLISESADDIRKSVFNPGGNLIILSLIIGLFQYRFKLVNLFPKLFPRAIFISILFISTILSFSRTNIIITTIIGISILGVIDKFNLKYILNISILIIVFILLIFSNKLNNVNSFQGKFAKSTSEIMISDYSEMVDINRNWRGYETYRAGLTFTEGGIIQKVFGNGFGSLVDLGFTMNLAGNEYDKIPILHNGYAYILVKTGVLGVFCYLLFYFSLLKRSYISINKSTCFQNLFLSRLLLGLSFSLMFSMLVVGGMAEIHDTDFVLLIGFILNELE